MRVHVNRQDIALGLQQESSLCGIAVAMKRQHPDWHRIRVTEETIVYTDNMTGERITLETPKKAAEFVRNFDHTKDGVAPFSFDLPPIPIKVTPPRKPLQPSKLIEQTVRQAERRRKGYVPTPRPASSSRRELRPI